MDGIHKDPESATVTRYFPERGYGFAKDKWGMRIFFRIENGRHCYVKDQELVMFARSKRDYGEYHKVPDPIPGDEIYFIRSTGSKGRAKAKPWTFQYMVADAWLDWERDQVPCQSCGHLLEEHSGVECQHKGCHCGDEAYENGPEEYTGTNVGGSPGGFMIYDSLA
jgi:hypothetical protein